MGQWFGRRALVLTLFMALMAMAAGRESSIAFTSSFQTETYTPTTEPPPYDSPPTYSPPSDSAPTTPSPDYNSPPSGSYSPTTPSSGSDSPPSSPSSPGPSGEYSNPTTPSPEYYSLAPESGSSPTAPDASGYSPPSPIVADVPAPSIDVPSTPTYSSPAVDPFNCPPLGGSGHGSWWRGTADSASTLTYGGDPDDVSPIVGPQEPAPVAYTPPVGGDPSTAPYTPDPAVPDTPVAPTDGTCTFWSSNTHKFPDFLTILTPILDIFGGNTGSIFGSQMTLFQGLTNSRPDAFGSLLRQGSAAVLNSYTNRNFAYTPFQVKSSFRGALVSQQAAAVQAVNFENANRGYMRRH